MRLGRSRKFISLVDFLSNFIGQTKMSSKLDKILRLLKDPEYESTLVHKQPIGLFIVKFLVELVGFAFCLSVALFSIISYPPWWGFTVYLTNWTLTMAIITFFFCAAASFERIIRKVIYNAFHKELPLWTGDVVHWIRDRMFMLSLVQSIFVACAYWLLVYTPGQEISYSTVGAHVVSAVILVFEFFFSTVTFFWWDFWIVFGYITFYSCFGVFHFHARAFWAYTVLDPETNKNFWVVYLLCYVIILGLWFAVKFFSLFRNHIVYQIWRRIKKIPPKDAETHTTVPQEDSVENDSVGLKPGWTIYQYTVEEARNNLIVSMGFNFVTITSVFILMIMFYYIDGIFYDEVGNLIFEIAFIVLSYVLLVIGVVGFFVNFAMFVYFGGSVLLSLFTVLRFITDAYYIGQNLSYKITSFYGVSFALCIIIYIHQFLGWISTIIYLQKRVGKI